MYSVAKKSGMICDRVTLHTFILCFISTLPSLLKKQPHAVPTIEDIFGVLHFCLNEIKTTEMQK